PLSVAINKVDSLAQSPLAAEFYRLGIRDVFPISAEHGLGVDDLLDHITGTFVSSDVPPATADSAFPANEKRLEESQLEGETTETRGEDEAAGGEIERHSGAKAFGALGRSAPDNRCHRGGECARYPHRRLRP